MHPKMPSPCRLQPAIKLLHVLRQQLTRLPVPGDQKIPFRLVEELHNGIEGLVPYSPDRLFLHPFFSGKGIRYTCFLLLNGRRIKNIRLIKSFHTLGSAHNWSADSSGVVYSSFSTSIRRSAKQDSASGPSQSFCVMLQTCLSPVKVD